MAVCVRESACEEGYWGYWETADILLWRLSADLTPLLPSI